MPEKTLYNFKVWCVTEAKYYQDVWREKAPTVCPFNAEDTIDANKTKILEKITGGVNEVVVREEEPAAGTGGHFQACSFEIDVPEGGNPNPFDKTWDYPVTLMALEFYPPTSALGDADTPGDSIEVLVDPDRPTGVLTADAGIGVKIFKVDQAAIDLARVGFLFKIDDEALDVICRIDPTAMEIESKNGLVAPALSGAVTKQTKKIVSSFEMRTTNRYHIGYSKIGGETIEKGKKLRITYLNTTGKAKRFSLNPEILY